MKIQRKKQIMIELVLNWDKHLSYLQLKQVIKQYELGNHVQLRTLEAAKKAVPKRVANANPTLRYYWLILVCKFSGKTEEKC